MLIEVLREAGHIRDQRVSIMVVRILRRNVPVHFLVPTTVSIVRIYIRLALLCCQKTCIRFLA